MLDDDQEPTREPQAFSLEPPKRPPAPPARIPPAFSATDLEAIREALEQVRAGDERRFTLAGLFALVTFASVVFALASYLPPAIFAGVTGLATLIGMVILSFLNGPPLVIQVAWWMLLAIYLAAIAWAAWH